MSQSSTTINRRSVMKRVTTHPGEVLREEYMKPLGLSANALAMALRVPATRISAIIREEDPRSVTVDTAARLARYFGTSVELWTSLQMGYDVSSYLLEKNVVVARDVLPRDDMREHA